MATVEQKSVKHRVLPVIAKFKDPYCRSTKSRCGILCNGYQIFKSSGGCCRGRIQVGSSNRWRLPVSLGSDLLGNSQALKATWDPNKMRTFTTGDDGSTKVKGSLGAKSSVITIQNLPWKETPRKSCGHDRRVSLPPLVPGESGDRSNPFHYRSSENGHATAPDVWLWCLGKMWGLHRPYLQKSEVLSRLVCDAKAIGTDDDCKCALGELVQERDVFLCTVKTMKPRGPLQSQDTYAYHKQTPIKGLDCIYVKLKIQDETVSKSAMAVALCNMYRDDVVVSPGDVADILAAAHALGFGRLIQKCIATMLKTIDFNTVVKYYKGALKYREPELEEACERWLQLNIVPRMTSLIEIGQIPSNLLLKVLKSNRIFTYGEHSLFKVLAIWTYLKLHPDVQVMPSYQIVGSYFDSLPRTNTLLEREEGQQFTALFMALRLHGITETQHLEDVRRMNILPPPWIVSVLTQHYHALQHGGDMQVDNFYSDAVRRGFVLDQEPHYHSELLSIYGFHFVLKAVRRNTGYNFYMERLNSNDPLLAFRQNECHTFAMRAERDVIYNIRVQWVDAGGVFRSCSSGVLSHVFGLEPHSNRSQVVTVKDVCHPLLASFAILLRTA